jgi:hypothetical protein
LITKETFITNSRACVPSGNAHTSTEQVILPLNIAPGFKSTTRFDSVLIRLGAGGIAVVFDLWKSLTANLDRPFKVCPFFDVNAVSYHISYCRAVRFDFETLPYLQIACQSSLDGSLSGGHVTSQIPVRSDGELSFTKFNRSFDASIDIHIFVPGD